MSLKQKIEAHTNKRIWLATRVLLGRVKAERSLTVYPDDVFLVSYPKSGNTWLRFLIGNLVFQDESITFANIERKVPDIYQHSDEQLLRVPRPRYLKSHEYYHPLYKKLIYLVRDPRDVAVSYYNHAIKMKLIGEDYSVTRFVTWFVSGEFDSHGAWGEHVGSWLGARRDTEGFILVRYEDLINDTIRELRRIAGFLCIDASDDRLKSVIEPSSANRMRELERQQAHLWLTTKGSQYDKSFIRAATVGSWRKDLPESSVEEIVGESGHHMENLGYFV